MAPNRLLLIPKLEPAEVNNFLRIFLQEALVRRHLLVGEEEFPLHFVVVSGVVMILFIIHGAEALVI